MTKPTDRLTDAGNPPTPGSGESASANEALNAMVLHEKCGVEPHLAVTLAASGVLPDARLLAELIEEIDA